VTDNESVRFLMSDACPPKLDETDNEPTRDLNREVCSRRAEEVASEALKPFPILLA